MKPDIKVWGNTIELFSNNTTSTHYLEIKEGGYCSEHRHAQKVNIFYVIEGELEITQWHPNISHGKELKGETSLNKGKIVLSNSGLAFYHMPRGMWHKFRALTPVKCIEVYDYKYDGVDIERRKKGGIEE